MRKMVCTKHKCRAITREFLSTYFDNHGTPHSLSVAHMNACSCIHHTSTHMSLFISFYSPNVRSLFLSLLYTRTKQCLSSQVHCAPCCMCHTSIRPRPQATIGARAIAPSSSSHCASHGGPLAYDSNPLCALSLSCVGSHRLNVFLVCCHAYICASPYRCRTQDANAAGAHRGAHERASSAPRGGGEGLRQASCNHTDVCIAQAGGSPPTAAAWCVT